MRKALKFASTVAATALLGTAFAGSASAETTLTIVSWGGAYSASQQKAYHDPYMKANPGVKIINDDSAAEAVAKLRAMVEAKNVTWDVVDMVASDTMTACDEGLIEPIDHDKILAKAPNGDLPSKDFGEFLKPGGTDCFIPLIVYSTTFGYRTDMLKTAPTSVCDIFDTKKFPGKRSLEKKPINNLEWALICDGVDPKNVYKELSTGKGVARAFKKLDTIKDNVVWWTKGAQPPQLLADGEVTIASAYNGRLFSAIAEKKQPIAMLWDWQSFDLDGFVVPKGKLTAEVKKYINFASDTQRLADQAKYISYGPTRASSSAMVGKHAELGIDMAPHMPTAPANAKTTFLFNYEWWADHRDEMDERFNAWLAK